MRNRKYAHWILMLGVVEIVILKIISGNYMVYVVAITLCVAAFMIKISEEEKIMNKMLCFIAEFIEAFARMGAGFQSLGVGYQPEVPEELRE